MEDKKESDGTNPYEEYEKQIARDVVITKYNKMRIRLLFNGGLLLRTT